CSHDSSKLIDGCTGSSKCASTYFFRNDDNAVVGLGFCGPGCTRDEDCTGTAGQKCQKETGVCLNAVETYAKSVGQSCSDTLLEAECNCKVDGSSTAGFCTHVCTTGSVGDALCNAAAAGWKCTAELEAKDNKGNLAFTGEPEGLLGECRPSCA